ncbi:MAG: hypothetical protein QOE77_3508 [Blastocatellia bacterium]|nr:hypothetical protein [Blastocatellia bacterium]
MDCRNVRSEINLLELHDALTNDASAHLVNCADCREVAEQSASLRTLVASLGNVTAPENFDMRLRARLARDRQPASGWMNFWRQGNGVPAYALAFALILLVGVVVFLRPRGSEQVAGTIPPAASLNGTTTEKPLTATTALNGSGRTNPSPGSDGIQPAPLPLAGTPPTPGPRPRRAGSELAGNQKASPGSREYSLMPAVTVSNSDASPVVSLSAPMQPLVVSMRDDRGGKRTISLPPVSFGSQKLIQSAYQPVSLASSGKGAW